MGFDDRTSNSNASSPNILYMTAPTSPNHEYTISNKMEYYYSAPASPQRKTSNHNLGSNLDEFEFEMSKRFSGGQLHSDTSESDHEVGMQKNRERGDSLPAMAFADELFLNGLVMPLKLPPRLLQSETDSNSFSQRSYSPLSSPRTVCKIPFARWGSWNDDFDPFLVALEKVREEKRGRNSHHRRSRSYSPFRATSKPSTDFSNQDFPKGNSSVETMQVPSPSYSGPLDFKGSAYARWVRDQTRQGLSPKTPKGFFFRQKTVKPLKLKQDGEESRVEKIKGFLLRYASFGRDNSGSKKTKTSSGARKQSYFGGLSFKFKGNFQSSGKKMATSDTNKAVVQYKPSMATCLGYGVRSP